jgi:hypothetical protein
MTPQSLPTFATMLLYWLLASYVATRSPRSSVSLTATGALVATALYLLGQGLQANAQSLAEWLPWARALAWGAHLAPVLWYWLTLLLLREEDPLRTRPYLRWIGYPAGWVFILAGAAFAISLYADDWLHVWSAVRPVGSEHVQYARFQLPPGPLYVWWVALLAATTLLAAANVGLAWRASLDGERRRRLRWLLVSALFFAAGANSLGILDWPLAGAIPPWFSHSLLAAGMVVMAWNVAAYSLLFKGQVIPRDFFYFLTAIGGVCALYGVVFLLVGVELTFPVITLLAITLTASILSHALVDVGRRILDRLFFAGDVQRLRSNLASVVQSAALTPDLAVVLSEAQTEIQDASTEHLVALTEQALRRLNNPTTLGQCDLIGQLPWTLSTGSGQMGDGVAADPTPLERAHHLRDVLVSTIERLRPPEGTDTLGSPAALQYHILREEYLQGLLNKQIMARHGIGEGTFHRNRRQAIRTLAQEIKSQEDRLARLATPSSRVS